MADKLKSHISGNNAGSLNAADPLFGIDGHGIGQGRHNPQALADLADKQDDGKWWARNGKKVRRSVEIAALGTAEKAATEASIVAAVNKFGKPIINAKYQAALDNKKFGHFLEEKKDQAAAQFGHENARHATTMQFQAATNNLARSIFTAGVQQRANQLKVRAASANHNILNNHTNLVADAALTLGSRAPTFVRPQMVQQPLGVTNPSFSTSGMISAGVNEISNATHRGGVFWFIGTAISAVRNFLGI